MQDQKTKTEEPHPRFDADFSPEHPQNRDAARARNLRYDSRERVYKDVSGCLILDQFGQPLG